jgi:hypothetical protein
MRTLALLLCLLATLVFAKATQAADVTLSWLPPTANTDGSTPARVGGYNVYSAPTDAALTALPNSSHGGHPLSVGNVLSTTIKNLAPGTYVYAVTAWYCETSATCVESDQSGHATTTIAATAAPKPNAPNAVKITVTVSAP